MADIKQAIEYAKKNPTSAFANELRKRIESGQMNQELKLAGLAVPSTTAVAQPQGIGQRVKNVINERGQQTEEIISGTNMSGQPNQYADQSATERGFKATATAFGAVPEVAKQVLPKPAREGLDFIGEKMGQGINFIADKISNSPKLQKFVMENPDAVKELESILGVTQSAGEIAGSILAVEGGIRSGGKVRDVAVDKFSKLADEVKIKSPSLDKIPNVKDKITEFISRDPEAKTATILKETPTDKFDKYMKIGEEAAIDPRKLTPYEVAGNEAQKALSQLDNRLSAVGQQKSAIIQKAKIGGVDMSNDIKSTVNNLKKSFRDAEGADKALVGKVIDKLQSAKRLQEVDKAIDLVQDLIYADAKNLTLSLGRNTTKQLRGVISELNSKVKSLAGTSYTNLNAKYSNIIRARDYLNKALGEKVDGIPLKGGALIKRFFSPSDAGTKKLFEFLKKELNVDLAQDTTIARFAMEMFNDARARALLDGVPTNPTGVISKAVDIIVDKTGLGNKFQNSIRDAEIRKARKLTK